MKAKEQALIAQTKDVRLYGEGQALQHMAWRVKNCVPNGNRLKDHEALSLAQISLATGLNPFTGELWYIPGKGPMAGIRGLRRRAREQSTYSVDFRNMTDEELDDHNIKPEDIGRVCLIFRHDVLQRAVEINKAAGGDVVPVKPVEGVGIWRKGDQVPSGKSSKWVADKRAEADGLRKAFDLTELPYSDEINGTQLEVVEGEASGWAPIDESAEKSADDLFGEDSPSVDSEEPAYEIQGEGRVWEDESPEYEVQDNAPQNITELYKWAQEALDIHPRHAANILQNYLKEQHGGGDIGAFAKTSPDNIRVLWAVLEDHHGVEAAELSGEPEPLPF